MVKCPNCNDEGLGFEETVIKYRRVDEIDFELMTVSINSDLSDEDSLANSPDRIYCVDCGWNSNIADWAVEWV